MRYLLIVILCLSGLTAHADDQRKFRQSLGLSAGYADSDDSDDDDQPARRAPRKEREGLQCRNDTDCGMGFSCHKGNSGTNFRGVCVQD